MEKQKSQAVNNISKRPNPQNSFNDSGPTKILKFGSLSQSFNYNQNNLNPNHQPLAHFNPNHQPLAHFNPNHQPLAHFNHNPSFSTRIPQSCPSPAIRPGVVSLSKTMDSPLIAICQTPLHLSNNPNKGFILPTRPPSPVKTIPSEIKHKDTPNPIKNTLPQNPIKISLPQNEAPKVVKKAIPTIRLSSTPSRQPVGNNPIPINSQNTTIKTNIPPIEQPRPTIILKRSTQIKQIPTNNVVVEEPISRQNSEIEIDSSNQLDIFSYSGPTCATSRSKDFENDNLEFAEYTRNEAYSTYEPGKYKGGKPHPYTVVESRSLSSTSPPDITYELKLPELIIKRGLLSNVQLEAVVYACQKHEEDSFDEERSGFLIGDGAGVGKGRTIGGVIIENYLHGRKKAIWVSVSGDLKQDAERDLGDIGNPIELQIKVAALNKMSYNDIGSEENGKFEEGVLFVTYSSLISKCKNKEKNRFSRRLDQIIDWFGKDNDGVMVFDECHKAKNLHQNNKTKTGSIVKKLQDKLKFARVVYASATGASEPKHMAYMLRLGLWGPGKSFSDFDEFETTLTSLGVGAMELIAIEMKKNGIYLARQLSFDGLKYEIKEIKIENSTINGHKFKDVYNKSVEVWNNIYREFTLAFKRNKFEEKEESNFEAQFWSAHQRFFKYLCIASKIEECVKISKAEVKNNNCVVIGLQSTGEARTMDLLEENSGDHDHFVSSARGVVESLIKNHYPSIKTLEKNKAKRINKFASIKDMESPRIYPNNIINTPRHHEDINGISIDDDDGEDRMLRAIQEIESMFPLNALDQLIHALGGPEQVAEMTGRKGRMVEKNGVVSYQLRKVEDHGIDQTNIIEKNLFNSGKKYFSIISDAASTGISLHSDKRFLNKRKRFHITLELPWSADKAIQQFGRTHRSNQVNAPHYMFLISDLAGEKRFVATVAKRLESLGALTNGDRRCGDSRDFSQFNLDNDIGTKAVHNLISSIVNQEPQVVPFPEEYQKIYKNNNKVFKNSAAEALTSVGLSKIKVVTVTKFLNRILGIELDMQNALFQYFLDIMEHESQKAKSRNEFDHGIRDIMNDNDNLYVMESYTFTTNSKYDNDDIVVNKIKNINGISWETAKDKYKKKTRDSGFYVSKSNTNSSVQLYAFVEYNGNGLYSLMRPNFPKKEIDQASLSQSWDETEIDNVKDDWEFIYKESKDKCIHEIFNTTCPHRDCTSGKRTKINYLITGAILLALKKLDTANINKKLEIIRVELFDKTKLIGALLPQAYHKVVMNALETRYNVPHVQTFSINSPESMNQIPSIKSEIENLEEVVDPKIASVRKRKSKNSSTPVNVDYERINDIIKSQLAKPTKPSQPAPEKKKPVIKKEMKTEEKKHAWKDLQFDNVIVNFISEEDL